MLPSGHRARLSCGERGAGDNAWWHFPAMSRPRFGPRQIRAESAMLRRYNGSTGAAPFDSLRVADIGDVNVNLYNLPDSCRLIRDSYQDIVASGCVPLTLGRSPRLPVLPLCPGSAKLPPLLLSFSPGLAEGER